VFEESSEQHAGVVPATKKNKNKKLLGDTMSTDLIVAG
jgi:hypothetical protein